MTRRGYKTNSGFLPYLIAVNDMIKAVICRATYKFWLAEPYNLYEI